VLVKVIYFAEFKRITEKDIEEFNLSSGQIKELIRLILNKYPNMQEILWNKEVDSISQYISVIVNNKPIHNPYVLSTLLKEGDEITFLSPISGG
jgi:MoaD family protein